MYFGYDGGRGFVKCAHADGVTTFPSYLTPARELDLATSDGDYMNRLVVTLNGNSYFVGELARNEGGSREFQKEKASHQNAVPLLVTALAMAAPVDFLSAKVVVGLPISDYRTQAKAFEQSVLGLYNVTLPYRRVQLELARSQVLCFPEAAGAAWDLLLNDQGRLVQTDLTSKTFGVLDIGWKTCNFVTLRNCMYEDSLSGTMPLGLSKAFRTYYKRISREIDITPAAAELRLTRDGEPELKRLAQEIKDQLAVWWASAAIDEVYLVGGGGAALAAYMPDYRLSRGPQTANARGFYKVARSRL